MHDHVVASLNERGFSFLIAGCATGKTLTMYQVAETTQSKRVLVLTTKSAMGSAWANDAKKHLTNFRIITLGENVREVTDTTDVVLAKNVKVADKAKYLAGEGVFVINYESAYRLLAHLHDFDLVVADESHKLGNPKSKQSKFLSKIRCPYKVAMTGTPYNDKPLTVYGQVHFLSGERVLGNWWAFYNRTAILKKIEHFHMIVGYKNLEDLAQRIDPFTMRVDTEDVLDLPPVMHIERVIPMTPTFKKFYEEFENEMLAEYGDDLLLANNKLTQSLRLHQLTSGYFPNTDSKMVKLGSPKLDELLSILDEIGTAPVVVFTRFTHDVEMITERLRREGIPYRELTGSKHEHELWQAGEGQVLVANLSAGNAGVNLDRARYAVYYSIGYSRTEYDQSLYRIRRDGSDRTKHIVYYHLIVEDSIDVDIRTAMKNKGQVSDYLLSRITNRIEHE